MSPPVPFDRVVAEHGPTVLRVCRAVLGAGPDAEDAWADTFLSALRAWPDLAADTTIEAWLVRVAGRRSMDVLRARQRRPVPVADVADASVAGRSVVGIAAAADPAGAADAAALWAAVAELPERQRLAIAYHYLGGLPHTDTADLIGGTADAVRRAAADGIRSLRRTLGSTDAREGALR